MSCFSSNLVDRLLCVLQEVLGETKGKMRYFDGQVTVMHG